MADKFSHCFNIIKTLFVLFAQFIDDYKIPTHLFLFPRTPPIHKS